MIPGMNPRAMKQAMRQLGIKQVEIDAQEVIIRTKESDLVISNPQVLKVYMMGQETFQISGDAEERKRDVIPDISEEDIKTIIEQTGCNKKEAEIAILENKGDLAAAIMSLKKEQ